MGLDQAGPHEFALLTSLLPPQPDLERALSLARAGYSPHGLIRLAAAHGVRPQLTAALKLVDDDEFAFVKRTLEDFQRFQSPRYLKTAREIAKVADALTVQGVPFMLLKGMALAQQLYGDISRRDSDDIDLLIPEKCLTKAESVLTSCGYKHELGESGEWRQTFLGYHGQYTFLPTEPGLPQVDLHWELAPRGIPFPRLDVWADPDHVQVANRSIPTVRAGLLPYYLAAHGAKESWRSLGWICDFAQLYHRGDFDWKALLRDAGPSLRGQILLGLTLIERVLGIPVKPELLQTAGDATLEGQVEATLKLLADPFAGKPDQLETLKFYGSWRERGRALFLLFGRRTVGDYETLPLPRRFWWAYHLIRPFRLAMKALSMAFPASSTRKVKR